MPRGDVTAQLELAREERDFFYELAMSYWTELHEQKCGHKEGEPCKWPSPERLELNVEEEVV